jgi:hypothetical protein
MPEFNVHYTLSLLNHQTGHQLKLELIDLPFPARSYRVRVNGECGEKASGGEQNGRDAAPSQLVGDALRGVAPTSPRAWNYFAATQ